jgi:hypothetical protein
MRRSRPARQDRQFRLLVGRLTETAEAKAASVSTPTDPGAGEAGFVDELGVFLRYGISEVTSTGDPDGFWSAPR